MPEQRFDPHDLAQMAPRYRARFINSLSGFKSANLVGTVDGDGRTNLSIVSSVFHLGAAPPLMGFIVRPHTVERHTLENLLETGYFTLNAVNHPHYAAAHQTSARYDRDQSEFDACGLEPRFVPGFVAPFVAQSPLRIGLRLVAHQPIALNQTELVIGEVVQVMVDDAAVQEDGYIDLEGLGVVAISGLDSYHQTDRLSRLSYAKPEHPPHRLTLSGQPEEDA